MSVSRDDVDRSRPADEDGDGDREVVAAIDRSESTPKLVIADITRDDVWLSVPVAFASGLESWR